MSCVAFGCNNTAFAAQLKLSDAAHARLTAETCLIIITECYVSVTSRIILVVEFVLRAFNNYFLHNGVINYIHSKILISPGMYTTRYVYNKLRVCRQFNHHVALVRIRMQSALYGPKD